MTSCKLRIATADDSYAVDTLAAEVRDATGLPVKPILQEIDRRELIVELALSSIGSSSPRALADRVKSSSPRLDVLGSWPESGPVAIYAPPRRHQVVRYGDADVPPVAHRALDDRVPTAAWQPKFGSENAHWLLAVPVLGADGRMVAALARRDGHYHRFSARDAAALVETLAA